MLTHTVNDHAVVGTRPAYKAYKLLQVCFVLAPLIAGADKFFNYLVNWSVYLAPVVTDVIAAETFMKIVGVVEIAAACIVAINPRIGGLIVAVWLWGIIANLLLIPGYFDIALRDFGLSIGALALSFLSDEFHS